MLQRNIGGGTERAAVHFFPVPGGQKVSPSFNPFSQKNGRLAPILTHTNPSKTRQIEPDPAKKGRPQETEKARKATSFRAFLALMREKSALAELRRATGGFEAVLLSF